MGLLCFRAPRIRSRHLQNPSPLTSLANFVLKLAPASLADFSAKDAASDLGANSLLGTRRSTGGSPKSGAKDGARSVAPKWVPVIGTGRILTLSSYCAGAALILHPHYTGVSPVLHPYYTGNALALHWRHSGTVVMMY